MVMPGIRIDNDAQKPATRGLELQTGYVLHSYGKVRFPNRAFTILNTSGHGRSQPLLQDLFTGKLKYNPQRNISTEEGKTCY